MALAGRVALVTGGGSGIGRAVCRLFALEGAKVACVDVNESIAKEALSDLHGDHECFTADVSSMNSVTNLLQNVKDRFSNVPTIVVNSAGITRDKLLFDLDEKSFDDVINVNLKGTFLVTQALAKLMVKQQVKEGSIVNIASIVGKVGNLGQCNYAASKAGVQGLTKTVAKELARFGIRCNAILPGFIETPMTSTVPDKVITKLLPHIPLHRMGKPEEVADTCLFLASPRSSYITGASIEVTGGLYM